MNAKICDRVRTRPDLYKARGSKITHAGIIRQCEIVLDRVRIILGQSHEAEPVGYGTRSQVVAPGCHIVEAVLAAVVGRSRTGLLEGPLATKPIPGLQKLHLDVDCRMTSLILDNAIHNAGRRQFDNDVF